MGSKPPRSTVQSGQEKHHSLASYTESNILSLQLIIEKVIHLVGRCCSTNYWRYTLLGISFLFIFIFTSPFFNFVYFNSSSWSVIEYQSENLLAPIDASADSHDAKKVFRLTVPVIAHLLHIDRVGLIIIQFLIGFLLIWVVSDILIQRIADRKVVFVFTLLSTGCYFFFSPFYDVFGRVDAFGYVFLALAMRFKNPLIVAASIFFASFCDERAFLNSWFVFIYWLIVASNDYKLPLRSLNLTLQNYSIILAWAGYIAARYSIGAIYGLKTPSGGIGLSVLLESRHYMPIAVFSTFGVAWWIIIGCFSVLIYKRAWNYVLLLSVGLAASIITSLLVQDINRSLAYSFPLLIISLLVLYQTIKREQLILALTSLLIVSLIIPIYIYDSHFHYQPNIFIRLIEIIKRP